MESASFALAVISMTTCWNRPVELQIMKLMLRVGWDRNSCSQFSAILTRHLVAATAGIDRMAQEHTE
jgi:hypothetical protein